jgi:D-alanyl-lipoteichoic acid acyltransferase DltB (MBOAT superfamily)
VIFNSFTFALFFVTVFVLYWALPRRYQNPILLVASYVFYGAWDWRFLSLIWLSTLTDYAVARGMDATEEPRRRRVLLLTSISVNLGILGVFKYSGFFVESFSALVEAIGLPSDPALLRVVLPVGISFYTFQTLGYSIDVFRNRIPAERDLGVFALYVAFFPQLVAGPIERAQHMLPQLRTARDRLTNPQVQAGLVLILIGLFKKVVIADGLAPIVNTAFAQSGTASGLELLISVWAFGLQIYGDFSGYSSIARGTAKLLGIDLMVNFRQPYLSPNITEFWRTWHISLSTWLRDYLYIPLGGNRGSPLQTYRNLMLTMLLGGLWHGAAWTFVIWGGLHGLFLAAHREWRDRHEGRSRFGTILPVIGTFQLVSLAWIFFRASSVGQAFEVLTGILTLRPGGVSTDAFWLLAILGSASLILDLAQRRWDSPTFTLELQPAAQGAIYGAAVVALILFSGSQPVPFIYFQF